MDADAREVWIAIKLTDMENNTTHSALGLYCQRGVKQTLDHLNIARSRTGHKTRGTTPLKRMFR